MPLCRKYVSFRSFILTRQFFVDMSRPRAGICRRYFPSTPSVASVCRVHPRRVTLLVKLTPAFGALFLLLPFALSASAADAPVPIPGLPEWAYPVPPPAPPRSQTKAAADPAAAANAKAAAAARATETLRMPGTDVTMTRAQLRRGVDVPDWHPNEHPAMPDIVKKGREPQVWACGYCHLPSGAGRPENSSVAGLPANYIKQQVLAFKHGERNGSEPRRGSQNNMLAVAKEVSEEEIEIAAKYFAALKPEKFFEVVEADTVPKTMVAGGILAKDPQGGTEPLGNRIVEMPVELERFENRDSRVPYEVYVPRGSVARGAALANTGGSGKTQQCFICHGPELKGLGDVPRLAGRSPSYLMRQLFDVKHGTRHGPSTALMKLVVGNLSTDDMLDLSAYMASLPP